MPKALSTLLMLLVAGTLAFPTRALAQASEEQPLLGRGVAAVAEGVEISFAEFDEAALWRHGLTQDGRAALRQLLELRLLRQMMAEHGLEISPAALEQRWRELNDKTKASAGADLRQYLEKQGIPERLFQRYLELSMAQEILARRALGIREPNPITSEQQVSWLEGEIKLRSYTEEPFPWSDGTVARCGDITIGRREYLSHLCEQLRNKDSKKLCFELLLAKKARARMPDLADAAMERAVEVEIEQRRAEKESDARYKGLPYEELLKAKGLSIEALRHDPAIRCAALAHLWVDRGRDQETTGDRDARPDLLRSTYLAERDFFDGRFGEAVEIFAIVANAAVYKNDLNKRTFHEADELLAKLAKSLATTATDPRRVRLEEFQVLATQQSEDSQSKQRGGLLGKVRRASRQVPDMIVDAAFELLERVPGDVSGCILGPIEVQGASALVCLGKRSPAPSWNEMAAFVHTELRRRFLSETLQPSEVTTWLE